MREYKATLENIVKMHKEGKIIFKCDNCESSDFKLMLNYKLPLPIIPVIILYNGTMVCYNELLYYFVRCICGENTSQEYSKLEAYKQNNIESKWVNFLFYEPYDDNFTEEELKFSFEYQYKSLETGEANAIRSGNFRNNHPQKTNTERKEVSHEKDSDDRYRRHHRLRNHRERSFPSAFHPADPALLSRDLLLLPGGLHSALQSGQYQYHPVPLAADGCGRPSALRSLRWLCTDPRNRYHGLYRRGAQLFDSVQPQADRTYRQPKAHQSGSHRFQNQPGGCFSLRCQRRCPWGSDRL